MNSRRSASRALSAGLPDVAGPAEKRRRCEACRRWALLGAKRCRAHADQLPLFPVRAARRRRGGLR